MKLRKVGGATRNFYRRVRTRIRMAGTAERAAWIAGIAVASPVVLPVFVVFYVRRRAEKRRIRALRRPFIPVSKPPEPIVSDPSIEAAMASEPDTFALVRVIGNDLPPRHKAGQSRSNLEFVLKNEPEFENCEKIWIVNRIVDPVERGWTIDRLKAAGQRFEVIPFDLDEYSRVPLDFSLMPEPQIMLSGAPLGIADDYAEARLVAQIHRLKNAYVMHNNGARNRAIELGRQAAKWVLPFDGNIFLTNEDWTHMVQAVEREPTHRYVVVPMARLGDNSVAFDPMDPNDALEEPQIAFRRDAPLRFDEAHPYGRRPKVELLARLGVSGTWDRNICDPWDLQAGPLDPDMHRTGSGGMVRRLASGQATMEVRGTSRARGIARADGIVALLRRADAMVLRSRGYDPKRAVLFSRAAETLRASPSGVLASAVCSAARTAMERGPLSVTHKTEPPPSGNTHDYYHPAPYWWPNPKSGNGLPYVRRDGERVPGTEMHSPESHRFDRTRWQMMVEGTLACALAHSGLGDTNAGGHARALVRGWFIDPETAMTPHLRYSQVRRGHNGDEGSATGIIEFKDIALVLDAVRLLGDEDLCEAMKDWLKPYAEWLLTSPQGLKERRALNNHGLCFDIQLASIAAFLDETDLLMECWMWSCSRLTGHFDDEGAQPHELGRTLSKHYAVFNLQNWLTLLRLYQGCGVPIEHQPEVQRVAKGIEWLMARRYGDWEHKQIAPFDGDRFVPLALAAADLGLAGPARPEDGALVRERPLFDAHDGIPPFWPLILREPPSSSSRGE